MTQGPAIAVPGIVHRSTASAGLSLRVAGRSHPPRSPTATDPSGRTSCASRTGSITNPEAVNESQMIWLSWLPLARSRRARIDQLW